MSFAISEVILLPIPFTNLSSRKVRSTVIIAPSIFVNFLESRPLSVAYSPCEPPVLAE